MKKTFVLLAYCLSAKGRIRLFCLFLFVGGLPTSYCPAQSWQWAKHLGGLSYDEGILTTDSSGNSYLTGEFSGTKGIFGNDTIQIVGWNYDIFIVKIDNSGKFIWSKRAGGNETMTSGGEIGTDILYDKLTNNIILCGNTGANFPKIDTCPLASGRQIFLSKIDTGGKCIWAWTEGSEWGAGKIAVDGNGDIYMVGSFTNAAFINSFSLQPGGFLAKFSGTDGHCLWAKNIVGQTNSGGTTISFYNNKLYVGGVAVNDTLQLDTATVYCYPNDIFFSEFDTAGNVQWVRTIGGPNKEITNSLSLDGSGNIYITGIFKDTAYFGSTMVTNGNNKDWFLAKYNNNGNFIWAKQAHISGNFYFGHSVSSDINGNVYVAGGFAGVATFGTYSVTAATAGDFFAARYDSSGNCMGVEQTGNYHFNGVGRIINDNTGGFHVAGSFHDTTTFGSYTLPSYGGTSDVFVARHNAITGIEEEGRTANKQLLIFANPTSGKCNIRIPDEFSNDRKLTLSIYDNTGKLIQQQKMEMNDGKIKLNLEAEAKGVYHAVLRNGKKSYNGKIVFE